ncbi:BglG family transcription antiterminator [Salimicrobium flavidum]|uniref:Transcriptional antiterminator, BglG family n=1 Tax=Salimicrobium flavidum TaxID=570947 RepID=A0A1N7IZX3_9BACI|nr:BglG family transcription antiterminator [Salimicrobium flavidum]SIS42653.1 transcriptional antiterminator, BglG family [Salimicrobium flavidum]
MYVTGRERKILELLFGEEDVTIKGLAEELAVSTRTIHRDLKGLETMLEDSAITIERTDHFLILLKGDEEEKEEVKARVFGQPFVDYTADERQLLLLSKLLESNVPLKLIGLASELNVTVATVSNDLDRVQKHVENFDLKLVRKRGYGVEIIGEEKRIREAMSNLIMTHMNEIDFLSLLGTHATSKTVINDIAQQLLGLVNVEALTVIEAAVREVKETLPYDFSDDAYVGLVVHLALAVERIRQKETIEIDNEYFLHMQKGKEFESAELLGKKLEENLNLSIPEAEIAYITGHLMGAKARFTQEYWLEDSSLSTAFKAKQLIEVMTKRTDYDFHSSDRLLNDLVVHLKPSIYRLQQNMDIVNPFTAQLENDYPDLFFLLEETLQEVFPDVTFPKDEVAYLVMHFASAIINMEDRKAVKTLVVCSSGVGTAKILSAKLTQQFSSIESVEHGSLFDLDRKPLEDYDLIISTVPLHKTVEYVLVNPVLQEKDVQKIEAAIRKLQVSSRLKERATTAPSQKESWTWEETRETIGKAKRYAEALSEVLDAFYVTDAKGRDSNEFLHHIIGELAEKDLLPYDPRVVQQLLDREEVGGLGIPGTSAALFHTRTESAGSISFTVHFLEHPVTVNSMDGDSIDADTVLLMLTPPEPPEESLETLSFISSLFVEEEESREVLESKEEARLKQYFSRRLNHFFNSKIKGDDSNE